MSFLKDIDHAEGEEEEDEVDDHLVEAEDADTTADTLMDPEHDDDHDGSLNLEDVNMAPLEDPPHDAAVPTEVIEDSLPAESETFLADCQVWPGDDDTLYYEPGSPQATLRRSAPFDPEEVALLGSDEEEGLCSGHGLSQNACNRNMATG